MLVSFRKMNKVRRAWIWLSRVGHCMGFGIQSPTDYRFVRYVINERWPYYAYETLGTQDDWQKRKLGRLYFRIANYLQPSQIIDMVEAKEYLNAACSKALIPQKNTALGEHTKVELAIVPIQSEYQQLFSWCDEGSVVVFENIYQQSELWHCIQHDPRTTVTFDLYYCGIVFFDKSRSPKNYIVNF